MFRLAGLGLTVIGRVECGSEAIGDIPKLVCLIEQSMWGLLRGDLMRMLTGYLDIGSGVARVEFGFQAVG